LLFFDRDWIFAYERNLLKNKYIVNKYIDQWPLDVRLYSIKNFKNYKIYAPKNGFAEV